MNITSASDDFALLTAIRQGKQQAFDILFRKYYPVLCAYSFRFLDQEEAEEVVQDVMLWVWENRERHIINTSLSNYLFRSVYHRSLDRISHNQLKMKAESRFYEEMHEMLEYTEYSQVEELTRRIEKAVEALPPTYREAFVMHRFQDMSYKEIATLLDVSPKTVDYRIQQALKILRVELKDYLPFLFFFTLPS